MLKSYPDFKKERLDSKHIEQSLKKSEQNIINDFMKYCSITAGDKKCRDIRSIMLQVRYIIEKPYTVWNLKDIRDFLGLLNKSGKRDWTTQGIKINLKKFLKWKYPDWSKRFNNLEDIKLKTIDTQDKYKDSNLINKDDLHLLINKGASSIRDKAMVTLLFESGARPQELCTLKWNDLDLDSNPPVVTLFSGKTKKARTVPIQDAVVHLKRWKQEYEYPNRRQQDYVFPSKTDRHKELSRPTMWWSLKKVQKNAGLEKNIYGYLFRHSRGNQIYSNMPEQEGRIIMGHKKDSKMPGVYHHGNSKTAIQTMMKEIYGIKEMTEETKKDLINRIERMEKLWNTLEDHPQFKKILDGKK